MTALRAEDRTYDSISVRAVLIDARGWIERGWCQRQLAVVRGDDECRCLIGAVLRASRDRPREQRRLLFQAGLNALSSQLVNPPPLSNWNDAPERTQAEVLALFDRTIGAVQ